MAAGGQDRVQDYAQITSPFADHVVARRGDMTVDASQGSGDLVAQGEITHVVGIWIS